MDPNGRLQGVSVNCRAGASLAELTALTPNRRVGVATIGRIVAAGGTVVQAPTRTNPDHCILGGITPQQAETLFNPTIDNPNFTR